MNAKPEGRDATLCSWCGTLREEHEPRHTIDECREYLKAAVGAANRADRQARERLVLIRTVLLGDRTMSERMHTMLGLIDDFIPRPTSAKP